MFGRLVSAALESHTEPAWRRWIKRMFLVAAVVVGAGIGACAWRTWAVMTAYGAVPLQPGRVVGFGEPYRIGLVVGHWQSDSGAVCEDGLREVDINQDIARRVQRILTRFGYEVELLPEFAPALPGYQADVLLSIHADSCLRGRHGFKIARAEDSAIPEIEDRLVACLSSAYGRQTGLAFDAATITGDMTAYHAFYEVAPSTPAAIIELGYMGGDRFLLTYRPEVVARGLAAGLICFIEKGNPELEG